ncbi:MAG: PilW family protein [Thermodesulfobacteriota bacterium]
MIKDAIGEKERTRPAHFWKQKGLTLIELLIALVISSVVIAAIYRVFVVQSKIYVFQETVTDTQQSLRMAMELLLRDLRMTGYDDDDVNSTVTIDNPIPNRSNDAIAVEYEYRDQASGQFQRRTVSYWREDSVLRRQQMINGANPVTEDVLDNVQDFTLLYGVDPNRDGMVDNWVSAADVGSSKVIAVQVTLTARPDPSDTRFHAMTPRSLTSAVTLRNLCLIR